MTEHCVPDGGVGNQVSDRLLSESSAMERARQLRGTNEHEAAYRESDGVMGGSVGAHREISIFGQMIETVDAPSIPLTTRTQVGLSVVSAHPTPMMTRTVAAT
jgi:hypothetical protein